MKIIENEFLKAEVLLYNFALPALDSIGYSNYNPSICIPRTFFISAHAPSKLKVIFKKSGKYYVNANLNRNTGVPNDTIKYRIESKNNIFNLDLSLKYYKFNFEKDIEYTFEIKCEKDYGAHTMWSFWKADEEFSDYEFRALQSVMDKKTDPNSDYSVFIQTCNPKKKMAFRCVVSLLKKICKMPRTIVICSIDNINDGDMSFPECVKFWTGRNLLREKMQRAGLSSETIDYIFDGFKNDGNSNMWLKYVIPRLCMDKEKILISDDDVAFLGPCHELIESKSYLTFMEDSHSFYGEKTIQWYNYFYKTKKYKRIPPYVCAGMCKVDCSKMQYDLQFIDGMIRNSESHYDEQCAVGMEIVSLPDYTKLKPPKYHHGGFLDQNVDLKNLELMHMQGRAVGWRENKEFIEYYMT